MLSIVAGFGVWGCQCFHLPRGQRPRRFSAPTLFARATVEEECSTDKTPMTLVMNLLLVTTTMLVDEDEHGDCGGGDGGNHDNNKFTFVMTAAKHEPCEHYNASSYMQLLRYFHAREEGCKLYLHTTIAVTMTTDPSDGIASRD